MPAGTSSLLLKRHQPVLRECYATNGWFWTSPTSASGFSHNLIELTSAEYF